MDALGNVMGCVVGFWGFFSSFWLVGWFGFILGDLGGLFAFCFFCCCCLVCGKLGNNYKMKFDIIILMH